MFAGLAELKDERLPALEKVVFENPDWKRVVDESGPGDIFQMCGWNILVDEETKLACEKLGIVLRAVPCDGPPARRITAAEWQSTAAS